MQGSQHLNCGYCIRQDSVETGSALVKQCMIYQRRYTVWTSYIPPWLINMHFCHVQNTRLLSRYPDLSGRAWVKRVWYIPSDKTLKWQDTTLIPQQACRRGEGRWFRLTCRLTIDFFYVVGIGESYWDVKSFAFDSIGLCMMQGFSCNKNDKKPTVSICGVWWRVSHDYTILRFFRIHGSLSANDACKVSNRIRLPPFAHLD